MNQIKYKIHRLSARAVMGHTILEADGFYTFNPNSSAKQEYVQGCRLAEGERHNLG